MPTEDDGKADLVGRSLAHFQVTAKLGEGGMGIVYRATDAKLGRTVALKVLPPSFAADVERRARFLREAKSAAAVSHGNIATVYEVGEADGRVFIAMELVEGRSLRAILVERGRPPIEDVIKWAKGMARGIAKAHAAGIVHRDLKPDNVMIDGDGQVKVLDFGLAKAEAEEPSSRSTLGRADTQKLTEEGRILGTPDYMAPEQAKGRPVDARTDVFSFGIVLYEMLTGKLPFAGDSTLDVLMGIVRDEPPPIETVVQGVPDALVSIVTRCLKKEPADRFASGRELLEALRTVSPTSIQEQRTVLDAPPSPVASGPAAPLAGPPRSRVAMFGALAALAGVALVALVLVANKARSGHAARSGGASAASASSTTAGPTAIGDGPAPPTLDPKAASAYAGAMKALRDAAFSPAERDLQTALRADPNLAAAHLELALQPLLATTLGDVRHHYEAAERFGSTLSPRDVALLPVAEARTHENEDHDALVEHAKAAAARFPDDAYVHVILGQALARAGETALADASFGRALALDPGAALPLWAKAMAREAAGDDEGAMGLYTECASKVPAASSCVRGRLRVLDARGQCEDLEKGARRLVALEPQAGLGYAWLARGLAGEGAAPASLREALDKQTELSAREPARKKLLELSNDYTLALLAGDFAAADQTTADWIKAAAGETSERILAEPYGARIALYLEEGDAARAVLAAQELVDRSAAWTHDAPGAPRGLALAVLHRAGKLTDAKYEALRDAAVAQARGRLEGRDPIEIWIDFYAVPAATKEEAAQALAAQEKFGALPPGADVPRSEGVGRTLFLAGLAGLAGTNDAAKEWLHRATLACAAPLAPLSLAHAHASLASLSEAAGDTKTACAEYAAVLLALPASAGASAGVPAGAAKPKSITADAARARVAALHCPH